MQNKSRFPTPDVVKTWFQDWFVPCDIEAEDFAAFLRGFVFRGIEERLVRQHRIADFPPWQAAVDILIRDLPAVIKESLNTEADLFGPLKDGETRMGLASALAELLLAARSARIPSVRRSYATNEPWHDYATQIVSYIIGMAKRAGKQVSISHNDAKAITVTKKALAACGYSVQADAIVKILKRNAFTA